MLGSNVLTLTHTVNQKLKLGVFKLTAVGVASGTARANLDSRITKISNILSYRLALHLDAIFFIKISYNILLL